MSLSTDRQFIERLAPKLKGFERTPKHSFNFRCPICGDSKSDPKKRRGYIYEHFGNLRFKCHNCGVASSLPEFLKRVDEELYQEYLQTETATAG